MSETAALPFALTSDSVDRWLNTLAEQLPANAANQLHQALKLLREEDAPPQALMPVLFKLTPLALHLTNGLSISSCQDAAKTDGKFAKIPRLCGQILRILSLLLCKHLESELLDEAGKIQGSYFALQCIGHSQRCAALFRETPSQTLWKKAAELYLWAEEKRCLQQVVPVKQADFKLLPNIDAVIKRNLLFALCAMPYPNYQDALRLFTIAAQHAAQLKIVKPMFDFAFIWNLSGEPPCAVRQPGKALPADHLAIDMTAFASIVQADKLEGLGDACLKQLRLRFGGYQKVFSTVIAAAPTPHHWLIGFDKVAEYLQAQDKLSRIMRLSSQASGAKPAKGLNLVPLEHEKSIFEQRIQVGGKVTSSVKAVNLLRISASEFYVLETRQDDCCIGDLLVFYNDKNPPVFGCARHIARHDITGANHVLVEPLSGQIEVYDYVIDTDIRRAIVLTPSQGEQQVFLSPLGRYSAKTGLALNHGKMLQLHACLEAGGGFIRFQANVN